MDDETQRKRGAETFENGFGREASAQIVMCCFIISIYDKQLKHFHFKFGKVKHNRN